MTGEPADVPLELHRAAERLVDEAEVGEHEHDDGGEHGKGEDKHRRDDEHRPHERVHAVEPQAGSAQADDRRGDAGGGHRQRQSGEDEGDVPELHGVGMTAAGATVGERGGDHGARAEEPPPQAGGDGTREGDRVGAYQVGHDADGEAEQQRQHAAQHERPAVTGEHLEHRAEVDDLRAGRVGPFGADDHGQAEAAEHLGEREAGEQAGDLRVVGRGEPPGDGVDSR